MASLITLEYSLPSLSSSPPTTMATSTSPFVINKPFVEWDRGDVETFLKNNQAKYFLDDECVRFIVKQKYTGRGLLMITEDRLVGDGMKRGDACTVMSLISEAKGVLEPRK